MMDYDKQIHTLKKQVDDLTEKIWCDLANKDIDLDGRWGVYLDLVADKILHSTLYYSDGFTYLLDSDDVYGELLSLGNFTVIGFDYLDYLIEMITVAGGDIDPKSYDAWREEVLASRSTEFVIDFV